ncbi:hypothetical protein J421_0754 [Gemmatirosa kalamazoonensis]|uniref:Uncharacterized protein n=1 Tax=Gemmatirosa kalamazoonensis TaxID=861299 RepID=W0RBY5_9BACT|nr:hypothetical protein [Gemmatirosa kalamazoonensis]AHG88291.1 hypothetical protein J421_0754 [Gemmatirosa kalamazoonensis]
MRLSRLLPLPVLLAIAVVPPAILGAQSSRSSRSGGAKKSASNASNASSTAVVQASAQSAVAAASVTTPTTPTTPTATAPTASIPTATTGTASATSAPTTVGTTTGGVIATIPTTIVTPGAVALTRTWDACGGPTATTLMCASIQVEVIGTSTVVRVRNVSGDPSLAHDGTASAGSWVLTTVGFDGIAAAAGTFTRTTGATTGSWWQPSATSVAPASWQRFDDRQNGGGVDVDFGVDNGRGISGGIASSCARIGTLPGGSNRLWMTPVDGCDGYAITDRAANDGWFETSFTTVETWDPRGDDVAVFFKGRNGPGGASYECLVGGTASRGDCEQLALVADGPPPGAVVPEPRTLVLVATGLGGVLIPGVRRRILGRLRPPT